MEEDELSDNYENSTKEVGKDNLDSDFEDVKLLEFLIEKLEAARGDNSDSLNSATVPQSYDYMESDDYYISLVEAEEEDTSFTVGLNIKGNPDSGMEEVDALLEKLRLEDDGSSANFDDILADIESTKNTSAIKKNLIKSNTLDLLKTDDSCPDIRKISLFDSRSHLPLFKFFTSCLLSSPRHLRERMVKFLRPFSCLFDSWQSEPCHGGEECPTHA